MTRGKSCVGELTSDTSIFKKRTIRFEICYVTIILLQEKYQYVTHIFLTDRTVAIHLIPIS